MIVRCPGPFVQLPAGLPRSSAFAEYEQITERLLSGHPLEPYRIGWHIERRERSAG